MVSWSMPSKQPGQEVLSILLCPSVLGQYFLYLDPSSQLQSVKVIITKLITLLHIDKLIEKKLTTKMKNKNVTNILIVYNNRS